MADTGDNMKYRQKKAAEYFVGEAAGNMEKAAVMAGYSKRYARGNAYKIFEIPEVKAYIEKLNKSVQDYDKSIADTAEIKSFWSRVMKDDNEQMKNRLRASELLAKAGDMFSDW